LPYSIVALGEILWDMLPSGKQMGGAPANFAYHAQELGSGRVKSIIVSSIGDDDLGREISNRLQSHGLSRRYITVDSEHTTGMVSVTMHEDGKHSFEIKEDVAWDHIPDRPTLHQLAKRADVVCFGSLAQRSPTSKNTMHTFLQHLSSSAWCIFDINLRQSFYTKQTIETSLQFANVLKLNDEDDLAFMSALVPGKGDEESLLRELTGRYALGLVVLTKGAQGSILFSQEQDKAFYHNGYAIDAAGADTVGAGDAFTAAIAVGLLKQYDYDFLQDCANRAAAFVCSQAGATPPLKEDLKNLFRP